MSLQPVESHWADQQPNAAECPQHDGHTEIGMRRLPSKERVVCSGNGGRRRTKQETVERQMMKPSAGLRVMLIRVRASHAVAVQIFQRESITRSSQKHGGLQKTSRALS